MLTSKICTEHAITCIQTAEAFPPGAQREKFFDMAKQWTDLAINIEGSEDSSGSVIAACKQSAQRRY